MLIISDSITFSIIVLHCLHILFEVVLLAFDVCSLDLVFFFLRFSQFLFFQVKTPKIKSSKILTLYQSTFISNQIFYQ